MLAEITPEELSASLDAVALELLEAAEIRQPPVDTLVMTAALGISVATDDRQRGRARCVRLRAVRGRAARPTILVRPEPRPERQHWAIAHEIGEHSAHRVFAMLGVDPREAAPAAREAVANHLAGRILLPCVWFASDAADCDWDLLELKQLYATASHELIARRMLDMPPAVIITIYDHGQTYFRRSNQPGRVPPPSEAETACWKAVHRGNQPNDDFDQTRSIRSWPVHEAGWKREILRTEVETEFVE